MSSRLQSILCLALLLAPVLTRGASVGRDDAFVPDPEPGGPKNIEEAEEWKEGRVDLPPWPRDADLLEIHPEIAPGPFRFFVDERSLRVVPKDAVVRYTLVVESANGTRNVSFEGIRCTLRGAYRVYAYGTGGRFSPIGPSDWLPIPIKGTEAYREDLRRNRFCVPRETRARTLTEIKRALRDQGTSQQTTGFQAD